MTGSPAVTTAIRGFHAQQAVEKALKAWLACLEVCFPRTHDLRLLFDQLEHAGAAVPEAFRRLERLSVYAVLFRYDAADAQAEDVAFESVVEDVLALIEHVGRAVQALE